MLPLHIILLLSLVQGFAEFIPISSAGHLLLIEHWLKLPNNLFMFDIALNFGTLLTILVYFRKHVFTALKELKSILTFKANNYSSLLIVKLFFATIPVVIVGFILVFLGLDKILRNIPILMACCLIVFGIILYLADRLSKTSKTLKDITVLNAFVVGCFQCFSLIPGASRSGSTITAARLLKVSKQDAVTFSFLMAIPSTLGAVVLSTAHSIKHHYSFNTLDMLLGVILSFLFGLVFIHALLKFLSKYSFMLFMFYRIILGILLILFYV